MTISFFIKLYFASLATFFLIDMVWLGLLARDFYRRQIGFLLSPNPNWVAAIIFYLLFVGGILFFGVLPGLQAKSLSKALLQGALFGLVTYATYDLTNLSTIKDWPLTITVVDITWGVVLATSVTCISYLVGQWLL